MGRDKNLDGSGERIRIPFLDDEAYLVGTRAEDGGIDYIAVVPYENRPENMKERMMVDAILRAASELSRRI